METIPVKTLVTRKKDSSWFGTEYNMNLYRGCSHGCIYCDSRSECYHIDNFSQVKAKENTTALLAEELRHKVKKGVIATGAMSDPYNPCEAEYQLTRRALGQIDRFGFGVAVATKSPLVTRDIDLYQQIMEHSPVLIKMTITTIDDTLSSQIEPNVAVSSQRFQALQELSQNGIFCGILLMPVLPFLEDNQENICGIVRQAAAVGARFIYPAFGMTMRDQQREYYYAQLDRLFDGLSQKYRTTYGNRYTCTSPRAKKLWNIFTEACQENGILYRMNDIISAYKLGYQEEQLSFF